MSWIPTHKLLANGVVSSHVTHVSRVLEFPDIYIQEQGFLPPIHYNCVFQITEAD